jgi:hypothetical protein
MSQVDFGRLDIGRRLTMTTKTRKNLVAATTALVLAALAMSPVTSQAWTPSASGSNCGNVTWTASVDLPGAQGHRNDAEAFLPRAEVGQALVEPKAKRIAIILSTCCYIMKIRVCGTRCNTAGW